uniref:Disease resistance RPP13-like protein 1 n=1 Tax=Cajanus cajan TaxID=3821 RepID=A0A151R3W4_CAJCA|nr:Putative disease resistance RPP13-like protein 1 [Cajanus cajan]
MEKLRDTKFLVVLDDVWIERNDNWISLKKPFVSGIKGSKILKTTRSENVTKIVHFDTIQV